MTGEGAALEAAARGWPLVRRFHHCPSVPSTQDEVRRLVAAPGAPDQGAGLLLVADAQTAGRGRLGRNWHSPAGAGLWLSLSLAPRRPRAEWPFVTALAALAGREALAGSAGLDSGIKWPNDLLVRGRKIAGVLAESATGGPLVLGVGVNLLQRRADFPAELRETATSIAIEVAQAALAIEVPAAAPSPLPSRAALLASWLGAFAARYALFESGGPAAHLEELRSASLLMGRSVEIAAPWREGETDPAAPGVSLRGRVVGFGPVGELVLDVKDRGTGTAARRTVSGGEIRAIEPPLRSGAAAGS